MFDVCQYKNPIRYVCLWIHCWYQQHHKCWVVITCHSCSWFLMYWANHDSLSSCAMDITIMRSSWESNLRQVDVDSFMMWLVVVISVLSMVSIDTSYGLVWSQIALLVGCATNNYSTDSVGQNLCSVMLVSREPNSTFPSLVTVQTVYTLMRN